MKQVAHDLNNHIAALLSFADLVLDELGSTHALRARIEAIRTIGGYAVVRSIPDEARLAQVAEHVAQLRQLAYGVLADVPDPRSPLYTDVFEITVATEQALSVLSRDAVRDAA